MKDELLQEYGIDYDRGLQSCMGDLSFYHKILSLFLEDKCFANAKSAYESKAYGELFNYTHEMKGVCGNVALIDLYQKSIPLVELLRNGTEDHNEVNHLFQEMERTYTHTCEGIRNLILDK